MFQRIFSSWVLAPTYFTIFIRGLLTFCFNSLIKLSCLVGKGVLWLCVYNNKKNIPHGCLHGCPCSARQITRSLHLLVSYRVKHSKRNSISTRAHVLFSIYLRVLGVSEVQHLYGKYFVFHMNLEVQEARTILDESIISIEKTSSSNTLWNSYYKGS